MYVQIKFPELKVADTIYSLSGVPGITKEGWYNLLPSVHAEIIKYYTEELEKEYNIKLEKPAIYFSSQIHQVKQLRDLKVI